MAVLGTLVVRLQAQIAEFQADFKKATESTEKFQQEFEKTATRASFFGNTFSKIFTSAVGAIETFGRSVLENASNITDLANKTGLATDTIQRFQFVAEQTGTSVDAFANAAFRLGTNLAGGSRSVVTAVQQLGLSFQELQRLSPDEQFTRVATALGKMDDAQERNRLGLVLFGREFRSIAPAISEGYEKIARDAQIAGDAQVKALDAAGDAWTRFQRNALTASTNVAGSAVLAAEEIRRSGFLEIAKTLAVAAAGGNVFDAFGAFAARGIARNTPGGKDINLPTPVFPADYVKQLEEARQKIAGLSKETREQIEAAKKMKATTEELTATFGLNAVELSLLNERTTATGKAFRSTRDEASQYAEVMKKIKDAQVPLTASQKEQIPLLDQLGLSHREIGIAVGASDLAVRNFLKTTDALNDLMRQQIPLLQRIKADFSDLKPLDIPALLPPLEFSDDAAAQLVRQYRDLFSDGGEAARAAIAESKKLGSKAGATTVEFFGQEFGQRLGSSIVSAIQGGGSVIGAIGGTIGQSLLGGLAKKLTTEGGIHLKGALGGLVSSILPAVGALFGPLIDKVAGLFSGLFGNRGRDLVKEFAASFGGFDELQRRLGELGAEGDRLWRNLTQGVGRNNPEQAKKAIAEVEAALAAYGTEAERAEKRTAALGSAIDGINTKAALFVAPFQALIEKQKEAGLSQDEFTAKLAALGEKGQAEFERIGTFAAAAFAGLVKETGDAIGALRQLEPTLSVLKRGIEEFGLSGTGTIDALLQSFALINDSVFGPILQNIQATGQIFQGLQDAGILTADLFQTVATDIGASFRELEAKGGDVARAMALSQPVLQRLFEAQQRYGAVTDETTARILRQAEEQGLVGDHMKDVNQKILDVLIAIGDVLGAKIPAAFRQTESAARDSARTIRDEFSNVGRSVEDTLQNIRIPKWTIPIDFDIENLPEREIRPLASGGIVRRPTLALVGESGPEAVIPLSQFESGGGSTTVVIEVDGRTFAEIVAPHLPGVVRRFVPA